MKVDLVTGEATKDVLPLDFTSHVHGKHGAALRMDATERQMWIEEYNNDMESRMPKTLKCVVLFLLQMHYTICQAIEAKHRKLKLLSQELETNRIGFYMFS